MNAACALLAAALALSGCATSQTAPGVKGLLLTLDPPAATQDATITVSGTVNRAAQVSIGTLTAPATSAWSFAVPVGFGHTNLTVRADDGQQTASTSFVAVRLASATFDVLYTMAAPPHPASSHTVWYDPDGYASAPLYEANATEHPPIANVHDVMVAWTQQTGTRITYGGPGSFGFSVLAFDGVGAPLSNGTPPYWCYTLNGDGSGVLGITSQEVKPGDAIVWEFAGCQ